MDFNVLLRAQKLEPDSVVILRHRPSPDNGQLNEVLPSLAAEKPDVFNAYQQAQGPKVERVFQRAKHVASFIGLQPGTAHFVGLYEVRGWKSVTGPQFWRIPANAMLKTFGMRGFEEYRKSCLWFDLKLTDFYADWKGKLIVGWPPPELSWFRWAHRNTMPVVAVLAESAFERVAPKWDEIDLSWQGLSVLSPSLRAKLSEWRGIYFIFDTSDGKGYVGSAYGAENILGRWRNYAARGHGGNRLLRGRNPENFRFTILQRVSPDMDADEVIQVESTWKERLHTRSPFGLNVN